MSTLFQWVWLIPVLPLAGFLVNGLFRRQLGKPLSAVIGCGVLGAAFVLSVLVFDAVRGGQSQTVTLFDFIRVGQLTIPFSLLIDPLSSLFLLIITGVGFLIHVYSSAYMKVERPEHFARYFAYLNLFVFSMLLLVLGSNFLVMFIGWEGVGLCSYLLIGYWFRNTNYTQAARKAFVMNRIGDLGFLLALFWMINQFGSLSFSEVFANAGTASTAVLTGITLLLFVGATGKSAQIPLYTWLPDAMAGPTPVSALIHAATMVTAGIYMIARSHVLFTLAPVTLNIVAITGLATALLAAAIALYQNDIKKILAYSTVSQLGFMFLALGVGAYTTGVFHVMTHAFFKALLFLGAGSVIHAMGGEQDITRMGGLARKIPVTYFTFLMGVLAICGFPFTSGFVSKDEILLAAYYHNKLLFWPAVLGAVLTAVYMIRLLLLTFAGSFRGTAEQQHHLHESPAAMTIPLVVLALLSLAGGWVQLPHVFGGHAYFNEFLAPAVPSVTHNEPGVATLEYTLLAVTTVALLAIYGFSRRSLAAKAAQTSHTGFRKFLANKGYVDEAYDTLIVKPLRWLNQNVFQFVEKEIIDWMVEGVGKGVQLASRQIRLLQTGQVGSYVLLMVISMVVFFVIEWVIKK